MCRGETGEGRGQGKNMSWMYLEWQPESLGLWRRRLPGVPGLPGANPRPTMIYIPRSCSYLVGELTDAKGMMMQFCGAGSTARWGLKWRHNCLLENGKDQQQSKVSSSSTFLWPLVYCSSHGHGKFYYPAQGRAQVMLPFLPMVITWGSRNGLQWGIFLMRTSRAPLPQHYHHYATC